MSCRVTSCRVTSCRVVSCNVVPCRVMSSSRRLLLLLLPPAPGRRGRGEGSAQTEAGRLLLLLPVLLLPRPRGDRGKKLQDCLLRFQGSSTHLFPSRLLAPRPGRDPGEAEASPGPGQVAGGPLFRGPRFLAGFENWGVWVKSGRQRGRQCLAGTACQAERQAGL